MRAFFDTSIFVASVLPKHPEHTSCLELLLKFKKSKQGSFSNHALAEMYATLSAHPESVRFLSTLKIFQSVSENLLKDFKIISLDTKDYKAALERVSSRNLRSGAIYDALHYQAALKAKAKTFHTLNVNDFERLSSGEIKISLP